LLAPGGKLIVSVPNANSFLKHEYNLLDIPPHHLTKWSAKSLVKIGDIFGLKVDRLACEPLADYHIGGYLSAHATKITPANKYWRFLLNSSLRLAGEIIRVTRLNRLLLGQTVYVCYSKHADGPSSC
jgi:hypothetical protein